MVELPSKCGGAVDDLSSTAVIVAFFLLLQYDVPGLYRSTFIMNILCDVGVSLAPILLLRGHPILKPTATLVLSNVLGVPLYEHSCTGKYG